TEAGLTDGRRHGGHGGGSLTGRTRPRRHGDTETPRASPTTPRRHGDTEPDLSRRGRDHGDPGWAFTGEGTTETWDHVPASDRRDDAAVLGRVQALRYAPAL